MVSIKTSFFTTLAILFCLIAGARVYTLRDGGGMAAYFKPRNVFEQKLILNGQDLTLRLGLVDMSLMDLLADLKTSFPDAAFAAGGNTLLVKYDLKNGWKQRLLLIYFGERFPVLQFSLQFPPVLTRVPEWPRCLPITVDGKPLRVIAMPGRKSWFGVFKTDLPATAALHAVSADLKAAGWLPFTGEAATALNGRGELFIRKQPLSVMLVNLTSRGIATVYTRPCGK